MNTELTDAVSLLASLLLGPSLHFSSAGITGGLPCTPDVLGAGILIPVLTLVLYTELSTQAPKKQL